MIAREQMLADNELLMGPQSVITIFGGWFAGCVYDEATQRYALIYRAPQHIRYYLTHLYNGEALNDITTSKLRDISLELQVNGITTDKQGALIARTLGGVYDASIHRCKVNFKSLIQGQDYNYEMRSFKMKIYEQNNESVNRTILPDMKEIQVYSPNVPVLYLDQYVYIQSNTDSNMWRTNGMKDAVIAVLPRNRETNRGQTVSNASLTPHTQKIVTSLSHLRNLQLRLCDSNGDLLQLDDDFTLIITVTFDVKQYYNQ